VTGVQTCALPISKTDTGFAKYMTASRDGTVIAASNGTTIWIYRWSGSAWVLQTQTLTNATYGANYVKNMKLTLDGSKILVCSYTSKTACDLSIYNTVSGSSIASIGNVYTRDGVDMLWNWTDWVNSAGAGMPYGATPGYVTWYQYTMDISDDSNTVIISCSNGPTNTGDRYGKVVIYDINYSTQLATNVGSYQGTVAGYDHFGKRVAI